LHRISAYWTNLSSGHLSTVHSARVVHANILSYRSCRYLNYEPRYPLPVVYPPTVTHSYSNRRIHLRGEKQRKKALLPPKQRAPTSEDPPKCFIMHHDRNLPPEFFAEQSVRSSPEQVGETEIFVFFPHSFAHSIRTRTKLKIPSWRTVRTSVGYRMRPGWARSVKN
jgi:hypothetical protein